MFYGTVPSVIDPWEDMDKALQVSSKAIEYLEHKIAQEYEDIQFKEELEGILKKRLIVKSRKNRNIVIVEFKKDDTWDSYYYLHTVVDNLHIHFDNDVINCYFLMTDFQNRLDKSLAIIRKAINEAIEYEINEDKEQFEYKMKVLDPDLWATIGFILAYIIEKLVFKV